jgi:hypothetical protein
MLHCRNAPRRIVYRSGDALLRNPITGSDACCARVVSGHPAAAPPRSVLTSRRRSLTPSSGDGISAAQTSTLIVAETGIKTIAAVHGQCLRRVKRRNTRCEHTFSALPPTTDMRWLNRNNRANSGHSLGAARSPPPEGHCFLYARSLSNALQIDNRPCGDCFW